MRRPCVVTRLIAAFYPVCVKEVTTALGDANGVPFRARGVRIVEPGWTILYPARDDDKKADEQELPEFRPGESGPHEPFVKKGETTPPKPYTEASLLGAMETAGRLVDDEALKEALREKGLGTPATRAAIIETLLARGYVVREKKAILATDAGRYLIALVRDRGLKSPELTGEWEANLREIERGRLNAAQFMAEIVRYAGGIIRAAEETTVDATRLGDCPRCGRPVIEGKRGFGCSGWKDGCSFVLWKEHRGRPLELAHIRELLQRRRGWRGGCKFAVWKTIAGKKISVRTAQTLLGKGRSPLLKGFKSKAGKLFAARLKLEDGAVRFDFEV